MKELQPILEKLASALGVGIDQLWSALLAQANIAANYHRNFIILWSVLSAIAVILAVICLVGYFKEKEHYDMGGWMGGSVALFFVSALFFVFNLTEMYAYNTAKNNPAFFAVEKILDTISGK